jgi:hypothetical protein
MVLSEFLKDQGRGRRIFHREEVPIEAVKEHMRKRGIEKP